MLTKLLKLFFGREHDSTFKINFLSASFGSAFLQITLSLLTFLTTIAVARISGDKGFGIYSLVFTWISIISSAALIGLDDLSIKQISIYKSKNQLPEIKSFILWGSKISLISSLFILIIYFLSCIYLPLPGVEEYKNYHLIAACTIPFFVIIYFFQSVLKGLGLIIIGQLAEKLVQPISFLIFLLCFYMFGFLINDFFVILFRTSSFVVAAIFILVLVFVYLKNIFRFKKVTIQSDLWKKSMVYFTLSTILFTINSRIDIVFLGLYSIEPEQIAYYNVALKFSDIALIPFLVICTVTTPIFASMFHKNEIEKLQVFYTLVTRISFSIISLIVIIFISFGPWFLNWYGKNFELGYDVLILLCISKLVHVFVGPANYLLSMTGFEKYVTRALIFGVSVTTSLHIFLIPFYGISGAAFATIIGLIFYDIYLAYICHKKTGLSLSIIGNFNNRKK
jgi:O-antigen/teichoic acid export membrane protein